MKQEREVRINDKYNQELKLCYHSYVELTQFHT